MTFEHLICFLQVSVVFIHFFSFLSWPLCCCWIKLLINLYFCEIFSAFATVNWRNYASNQTGGILSTAAFRRVPRYCFSAAFTAWLLEMMQCGLYVSVTGLWNVLLVLLSWTDPWRDAKCRKSQGIIVGGLLWVGPACRGRALA